MKPFSTIDEVLLFAINAEQEAADFYLRLAGQSVNTEMKQVFNQYAREEMKHKERLQEIRKKGLFEHTTQLPAGLNSSVDAVDATPGPDMTYTEALALAMKKEQAAFRLYLDLAGLAPDEQVKAAFTALAEEEARHKLRFEIEYGKNINQSTG